MAAWGWPPSWAPVDALLDDPAFLAPLAGHFDPRIGRPSVPLVTYLRIILEVPLPAQALGARRIAAVTVNPRPYESSTPPR